MEYNYEYMFFKYIYKKLNLQELDKSLQEKGIKPVDEKNIESRISRYFSLLNQGDTSSFTPEEKTEFDKYFSQDVNSLSIDDSALANFLEQTYSKFFHLNEEVKYVYYGPDSMEFMAPSNAIALGINYVKYDLNEDNYEQELDNQEGIIVDMLNYIQMELAKKYNMNLAAMAYNEVTLSQPFIRI